MELLNLPQLFVKTTKFVKKLLIAPPVAPGAITIVNTIVLSRFAPHNPRNSLNLQQLHENP